MSLFTPDVHYVVTGDGCHQWIRATSHDGYAFATVNGRKGYAHRAAWEAQHGELAPGDTVDHLCFNPGCINLDHLRVLDFLTNARLQRSAFKTHCVNGHEYTPSNTYRRPSDGRRACRTCKVQRTRAWRARVRAGSAA